MLMLEPATEEIVEKIYKELNTTPQAVQEEACRLVQWFAQQPHLPNVEDEDFLINSLLQCKNNTEKCKHVLERYFTLKSIMPEIYFNRDPCSHRIEKAIRKIVFIPLPKLTPDGCRVNILRVFDPVFDDSGMIDDICKIAFMGADIRIAKDKFYSDTLVIDFQNFTGQLMSKIMANVKKLMIPGTKGLAYRQRDVYLINAPPSAEALIMLIKSFVRKDLLKRVIVLKTREELLDIMPKKMIPTDYGGEEKSLLELREEWLATLRHYRDWFLSQENMKVDNSKKLVHGNTRELFDLPLDGSFRKITLD